MIDVPIEIVTSPSTQYLDLPLPVVGSFTDAGHIEGGTAGGGGAHPLFNSNNYWFLARDGRAVQSDGYVLIDYDGDMLYDQGWFSQNGVWYSTTGGGRWSVDDGPMDELEELWERGFTL